MLRVAPMLLLLSAFPAALPAEDAAESLRSWTAFGELKLDDLASGKVLTSANSSMSLERGMASQAVFLVNAPADATLQSLLKFNAAEHPELEVSQHHVFQNESDAAFVRLQLDPKSAAVAATIRSIGDSAVVQLSAAESALVPKEQSAATVQQFLSSILRERWTRFAREGDLGGVASFDAGAEMRSLIAEEPKIAAHFAAMLGPLNGKATPETPRYSYWEQSVVDKNATVVLGAVYVSEAAGRKQVLDITYYSSSGYLAGLTLYELLPITMDGREKAIVWQGSFITSARLAGGFGIKRKIGSRMMLDSVERWVGIFRKEAKKAAQ